MLEKFLYLEKLFLIFAWNCILADYLLPKTMKDRNKPLG